MRYSATSSSTGADHETVTLLLPSSVDTFTGAAGLLRHRPSVSSWRLRTSSTDRACSIAEIVYSYAVSLIRPVSVTTSWPASTSLELHAVAVDVVARQVGVGARRPGQDHLAVGGGGHQTRRCGWRSRVDRADRGRGSRADVAECVRRDDRVVVGRAVRQAVVGVARLGPEGGDQVGPGRGDRGRRGAVDPVARESVGRRGRRPHEGSSRRAPRSTRSRQPAQSRRPGSPGP